PAPPRPERRGATRRFACGERAGPRSPSFPGADARREIARPRRACRRGARGKFRSRRDALSLLWTRRRSARDRAPSAKDVRVLRSPLLRPLQRADRFARLRFQLLQPRAHRALGNSQHARDLRLTHFVTVVVDEELYALRIELREQAIQEIAS